jgi:hypothetical protein
VTKTQATALARQARRYGHFDTGRTLYLFCPVCKRKVEEDFFLHDGTKTRQLDRMMIRHLTEDCEA